MCWSSTWGAMSRSARARLRLMQAAGLRRDDQAMMPALQWVAQQAIDDKRRLSLADIREAVSQLGLLAARPAKLGITLTTQCDAPALVARPRPVSDWQPDRLGVHRAAQEHDGLMLPPTPNATTAVNSAAACARWPTRAHAWSSCAGMPVPARHGRPGKR